MNHRRAKARHDVLTITRFFFAAAGRPLLLGALLSTLTVLIGVGLLGVSGWFITATALAGLSPLLALQFDVFMPSAAIRLLALGRTVSRYGERVVTHDATLAVLAALRERVFLGWAQPMAARTLAARPSRWLFRLTGDIDALETIYLRLAAPAIAALGAALLAGLLIGMSHPGLGVAVCLALIVCGGGIAWIVMARARPASMRRALALESLRAHAIDLVAGQTELVMANRMDAQRDRLHDADSRLARADLALNRLDIRAGWASGVTGALIVASVLVAAAALVHANIITTPVAALMVLVAQAAMEPFGALRRGALEAGRTWLAARRIAPRLRQTADPNKPVMPLDGLAVSIRNATVTHTGESHAVLRDIALDIAEGERVAIVGESGAGKSTLLALIAGELQADPAGKSTTPTVATLTTTLFTQRTELFQDSVRDNLRIAEPMVDAAQLARQKVDGRNVDDRRVDHLCTDDTRSWQALTDAGLAQDIAALPSQLDTPLGEGGMGLSGGQSRRLALARLLLTDTRLWLLDEPTEGLDSQTAHDVLTRLNRRMQQSCQHRTLIIATHLQREAALANRLLVIHAGRITQDLHRNTPEFDAALAALRLD